MAEVTHFKYRAFLSYSHSDMAWAKWLHAALEKYRIDRDLIGRETPVGIVPKSLRPIFRDREDFSAGHSLTDQTAAALEASQFLIVICSPDAARSEYVNEEVRRFKATGREHRIIPLIVGGEPGNPERECFPPALRLRVGLDGALTAERQEPIASDARPGGDGKELAKQKVVAGILGLPLDEIVRRADRARRRRNVFWAALAGIFLVLALAATGSAIFARKQLETNEAFLDSTLRITTNLVHTAVAQAIKYNVPRTATLELLGQAERLFGEMARLGRATPELQYRKAQMLIEFARNYSVLGRSDLQLARAQAALQICEGLTKQQPYNLDWQLALADSYIELGDALRIQGQLDVALLQYEVSNVVGERFDNAVLGNRFREVHLISSQRIGDVLLMQGKLSDAAIHYRTALSLSWDNPIALERIANVYFETSNLDGALEVYRRMLAINERSSSSARDNTELQRNVSISHHKIGTVFLAQGKLAEALQEFRASLAIADRLAATDPTRADWQRDIAVAHGMIGDVLIAQGRAQDAANSYRTKIDILQRLAASDARNSVWEIDLSVSHASMADAYIAQGRLDDALSSYRTSHDALERVVALDPTNVQVKLDLLWSHSRLTLFGDEPTNRWNLIVSTLYKLKDDKKLIKEQERWIPIAERGRAAVDVSNRNWKWDLLMLYWRTANLTKNPVRQVALVVAMIRRLSEEGELTPEQERMLPLFEERLALLQTPAAPEEKYLTDCQSSQSDRAIIGCTHIIDASIVIPPTLRIAYENRGNIYKLRGRFDDAISDYDNAIAIDHSIASNYDNRGLAFQAKGDLEKALMDYGQAIQVEPKHVGAYLNRGSVYSSLGQLDLAIDSLTEAVRLDPRLAVSFNMRGVAHLKMAVFAEALNDFNEAIALEPNSPIGYSNRGRVYEMQGRFDDAIVEHDIAIRLDPKFALAYANRGLAYEGKGDKAHALAEFEAALAIDPKLERAIQGRDRDRRSAVSLENQ